MKINNFLIIFRCTFASFFNLKCKNMVLTVCKLLIGLVLLFLGGNWLVDGGVAIAKRFKISPLVIGMTIVAMGTSAPELIVSLLAAAKGNSGIAMGNVIGSNIANIGLILGLTALICPIIAKGKDIVLNGLAMIIISAILVLMSFTNHGLSRIDGAILVFGLILFITISIISGKKSKQPENEEDDTPSMKLLPAFLLVVVSCGMLAFGADMLIDNATIIAKALNISDKVIGLTIVALGTSLPELAASLIAATKKQMDISLGNVIGSNIFNILAVLGISSTICPIPVDFSNYETDFVYMLLFGTLLITFILPWKSNIKRYQKSHSVSEFKSLTNGVLGRISGFILLAVYVYYVIRLF